MRECSVGFFADRVAGAAPADRPPTARPIGNAVEEADRTQGVGREGSVSFFKGATRALAWLTHTSRGTGSPTP